MNIWFKYAITALMVVLVSEFAKRSDKLGGFIAALPLVTILTLVWLYLEHQSTEKIANHAYYTFWYVIPMGLKSRMPKVHLLYTGMIAFLGIWMLMRVL